MISGNRKGDTANNVFLPSGRTITVGGALSNETPIGVSMAVPGTFTAGGSFTEDAPASTYFASDVSGFAVWQSEGQGALAVAAVEAGGATTCCAGFDRAVTAWNSAPDGANLRLLADVTINDTIKPSGTKTLDLNGYGIRCTNNTTVIGIERAVDLTLADSNPGRTHYITLENGRGTGVSDTEPDGSTAHIQVSGGYITGGDNYNGGGVYVVDGVFTMTGGTICGNTAIYGGGVYFGSTVFILFFL